MSCKQSIAPEKLCSGLPDGMKTIWISIKDLGYEDEPNYALIKTELQKIFEENGWEEEASYDWEINPQIIYQLTPFPELFERNLMETQRRLKDQKQRKKVCAVQ
jgi:hypothetical protein